MALTHPLLNTLPCEADLTSGKLTVGQDMSPTPRCVPYPSRPCEASASGWQRCSLSGSWAALGYCPEAPPPSSNPLSETAAPEHALFRWHWRIGSPLKWKRWTAGIRWENSYPENDSHSAESSDKYKPLFYLSPPHLSLPTALLDNFISIWGNSMRIIVIAIGQLIIGFFLRQGTLSPCTLELAL